MRDFHPKSTPAVSPDFSDGPKRKPARWPGLRLDPPEAFNRPLPTMLPVTAPDPAPAPDPMKSEAFDGSPASAGRIVAWAATPGAVTAVLDASRDGSVECTLRVHTASGEQVVQRWQALTRNPNGAFEIEDGPLAELARLCEGVDPFASSVQAAPRPSTRDT